MWNFTRDKKSDNHKYFGIKSFSYFLPAPPKRQSGYQEKEFDRIIEHLSQSGFELLDMRTQAHSHGESAGVWIFCRLGALNEEAASTAINIDYQDIGGNGNETIPMDPDIVHDS